MLLCNVWTKIKNCIPISLCIICSSSKSSISKFFLFSLFLLFSLSLSHFYFILFYFFRFIKNKKTWLELFVKKLVFILQVEVSVWKRKQEPDLMVISLTALFMRWMNPLLFLTFFLLPHSTGKARRHDRLLFGYERHHGRGENDEHLYRWGRWVQAGESPDVLWKRFFRRNSSDGCLAIVFCSTGRRTSSKMKPVGFSSSS